MAINYLSVAYLDLMDYLIEKATPEEILAYKASEKEERRAAELLEKNNAGTLTPQEAEELADMQQVDRFVALMKSRALRAHLKSSIRVRAWLMGEPVGAP